MMRKGLISRSFKVELRNRNVRFLMATRPRGHRAESVSCQQGEVVAYLYQRSLAFGVTVSASHGIFAIPVGYCSVRFREIDTWLSSEELLQ